jgi:hypothetical protein
MLEVRTSQSNLHIFLLLTGQAFDNHAPDANRSHGFYWAQRWLAREILGASWLDWLGNAA